MSSLQKHILKARLPPRPVVARESKRTAAARKKDYTPVQWSKYFQESQDVSVNGDSFRVYLNGSEGPAIVLLHGGGLSALGWALFTASISQMVKCRVVAVDMRGHGNSKTTNDFDLSADTLSKDIGSVIQSLYGSEPPPIILMGHSMGGAIAVHTAYKDLIPSLIGLVVIDVVEGTAMDALSSMQSFLRGRPKSFATLENAVEWCVRSGQVRNLESAKVSMPGQIINCDTGELAINDVESCIASKEEKPEYTGGTMSNPNQILEEESENGEQTATETFKPPISGVRKDKYKWRIDLGKTESHWPGWFKGLSNLFLSCPVPKLLILAGIDTLDKDLTVGQMQGKFQMQVLPQCGHSVHEDVPDKVAEVLASFMVRFRFAEPTAEFNRPFPGC